MKTLAADFTIEKNKITGYAPRTLLEIDADSGTLYYSDQDLTVGSQTYSAKVVNWGNLNSQIIPGDNTIRTGGIDLELFNYPRIDSNIRPGLVVRIYLWSINILSTSKKLFFKGVINDNIEIDFSSSLIRFGCADIGEYFDKEIGDPLTTDDWSGADPDDVGKIMPIVYGTIKNHQCLSIDAGAVTTVWGSLTAVATTVYGRDITRFPSSGTIRIGNEEITYTGKSGSGFTGCTRGANGTTATTHAEPDAIVEVKSSLKYLAFDHKGKQIDSVSLMPLNGRPTEALKVDSGDYTVNTNDTTVKAAGQTTITLNNIDYYMRQVAISVTQQPNQPITSTGSHPHTQSLVISMFVGTSASAGGGYWSNTGNSIDSDSETYAYISLQGSDSYYAYFDYSAFSGTIVKATCVITYKNGGSSASILNATHHGWLPYSATKKTVKVDATSGRTWSNLDVLIQHNSSTEVRSSYVYAARWEIQYQPDVNDHAADGVTSNRITDAEVGGDSVAQLLRAVLIVDGVGWRDTAGGHITGVANQKIEIFADVFHHILETYGNGVTHSDIDVSGSFTDAETNLPASYLFSFVINQSISMNRLLTLLAQQCWCRFMWEAGIAKLIDIKTSGSSAKGIDIDTSVPIANKRLPVIINKGDLDQIINDIELKYNLDYTLGGWNNADAYEGISTDTDSTSITNYGTRKKLFLMFAIGDNSTMADDLRGKILTYFKVNRRIISFPSIWTNTEVERGDIIGLTFSQLSWSGKTFEVLSTDYSFPKAIEHKSPKILLSMMEIDTTVG